MNAHRQGLSISQARARPARDGANELPRAGGRTRLRIVLDVLHEPMLALLLAAGAIYFVLGDRTEALILFAFAGLSIAITIVQEREPSACSPRWTRLAIVAGVGAVLLLAFEATKRIMPTQQSDSDPDAPTSG